MKKILFFILLVICSCQNDNESKDYLKKIDTDSYPGSVSLIHKGIKREYYVYLPSSYNKDSIIPVMFNFHGGSGNIADAIEYSDMRSLADINGFILLYPQAIGDQTDSSKPSPVWTYKTIAATAAVDNIGFIEVIIDSLAAEYNIDQERIYACGYSNGGEFSQELAVRLSSRIASIASVSSSMQVETFNQTEQKPMHPFAVLTINGTEDNYYQYNGTLPYFESIAQLNNYWTNHNQCNTTPLVVQLANTNTTDGSTVERHTWSNVTGEVYVEHLKIIGGGHDFPGSFGNMDINSNNEIWNFVSQYDINGIR